MDNRLTYNVRVNPVTKIFVLILIGFTLLKPISEIFLILIVLFYSILFWINRDRKSAVKNLVVYLLLCKMPNLVNLSGVHPIVKVFLSVFFIAKIFYLPYLAGKYFVFSSDVASIISSMDMINIPQQVSVPLSVVFRFFPSFKQEQKNIRMAMKIRGISLKNPIKYLEYVMIPLLIVSCTIADDIAKAAETKCIAKPCKKERYYKVGFGIYDFLYVAIIILLLVGGLIW
ncbi:MAG: energy-coupling factor transporter transmembrane component T [Finegoldia magna]|nr:energy-coupling factor transporter transmembrane component T [Finegoldia magna]